MSNQDILSDYELVKKKFDQFNGCIEIEDFRTFLLLSLSDENDDMVKKIMAGNDPNRDIWYDVGKKSYFFEMSMHSNNAITIYLKHPLDIEGPIIKSENKDFWNKHLSKFEQKMLIDSKTKLRLIKVLNKTQDVNTEIDKSISFEVTKVFDDFLSYLFAVGQVKSLLVIQGEDDEPDIIFTFALSISNFVSEEYIPIFAFVDHEKRCRGHFLKLNKETLDYESVEEIKESTHSELYNSEYLLIVKIKNLNVA